MLVLEYMGWRTRQVELPVKFGIYSLDYALAQKRDLNYAASVDAVVRFLEGTKGITDNEALEDRLEEAKDNIDELQERLDDESPLVAYLTSLRPEKRGLFQSLIASSQRTINQRTIKTGPEDLRDAKYFAQISRTHNRRRIFGQDISDCTYIAEPFNDEMQLIALIDGARIPEGYRAVILAGFNQVKQGSPEKTGEFSIITKEGYHPVVSRMASGIEYAAASGGAVVGTAGGLALGVVTGVLFGGAGILISGVGIGFGVLASGAGLLVTGVGIIAGPISGAMVGVAYGASKGAQLGCLLRDRITGNHN